MLGVLLSQSQGKAVQFQNYSFWDISGRMEGGGYKFCMLFHASVENNFVHVRINLISKVKGWVMTKRCVSAVAPGPNA